MMQLRTAVGLLAIASAATVQAALVENFDDVSSLPSQGWVFTNNSDNPFMTWGQGDDKLTAYSGGAAAYLFADYSSTHLFTDATVSNWALTPEMALDSTTVISFFTTTEFDPQFADRLQVRLSTSGSSTNVGSTPTDVGDFDDLLLDINPNYELTGYPTTWTQYQIPLSGVLSQPVSGRIALRYFVEDAGLSGNRSNAIGVDEFTVVPEPSISAMAMGVACLSLVRRRR